MQTQNLFFDDIARLLGGAAGTVSGIRNEIEGLIRHQFERLLSHTELVSRDEFEMLYTLIQTARGSQENLEQRLSDLEARIPAVRLSRRPSFARRLPSRRRAAVRLRQIALLHKQSRVKRKITPTP